MKAYKSITFILSAMIFLTASIAYKSAYADSLDVNLTSLHFDKEYNYNEENFGLGYTKDLNKDFQLKVGNYKNSFNMNSNYLMLRMKADIGNFSYGVNFGGVTGYSKIANYQTQTTSYYDKHRVENRYVIEKHTTSKEVSNGLKNYNDIQFIVLPTISYTMFKKHTLEIGFGFGLFATLQYQYTL